MFNCLANIASIVTLVLFAVYLIGRVIRICNERKIWRDVIVLDSDDYSKYGIVEDVFVEGKVNQIGGLLVSKEGIRNLKVYSAMFDDKNAEDKKEKLLLSRAFLNINQAVAFHVDTGDIHPTLFIEYTTKDYMKVEIEWRDNLKNGVMSELIQPRHTWKSVLYYLFA